MKTKKLIFTGIFAFTFAILLITACKKKEEVDPTPPVVNPTNETSQQTQRASDQSNVDNEATRALNEANSAMQEVSTTREVQTFCDMVVDTTYGTIGKLTLNYNGANCYNGTIRTGSITVQLPYSAANGLTRWSAVGAKAILTYNNFKVTRVVDNKSLTFNGTQSITNVNGGGLMQLYLGNSLVYKISGDMQLSFNDSTSGNWKEKEIVTYSYNPNTQIAKATVTGDTVMSGHNNVAYWGTNRIGDNFIVDMPTAFTYDVFGPACLYRPLTGVLVFYGITHSLTLTYGVDATGAVVTTGCPYGYKFSWTNALGTQQIVLSY